MKEKYRHLIEEEIKSEGYIPQKAEDLSVALGIEASELDDFYDSLAQMERDGLCVCTKRGKIMTPEASGLVMGTYRGTSKSYGFVTPEGAEARGGDDIFISSDKTMYAIDGDRVLVRRSEPYDKRKSHEHFDKSKLRRGRGGRLIPVAKEKRHPEGSDGEIVRIVERAEKNKKIIGVLNIDISFHGRKRRRVVTLAPDSGKIPYTVYIPTHGNSALKDGDKVEVEIVKYPSRNSDMVGEIISNFGDSGTREANYAAILAEYNINPEFPEDAQREAGIEARREISTDGRRDLRDKIIFTIDGEDAKDLDDAISIEKTDDGYILGVHIADVSEYVREKSAIDKEAMARGTSVYFTDKVVPMLPRALSNGACSLDSGKDCYALSAFISLDGKGAILDVDLCESVISSCVHGYYSEVNKILSGEADEEIGKKYEKALPSLRIMKELYLILAKRAAARGAVELDTEEAKILVDKNGYPIDIIPRERGDAERLIEQFMLCANEAVATWLTQMSLPCVYRVHEPPSPDKLHSFTEFAQNLGLDIRPLRATRLYPSAFSAVLSEAREKELSAVLSAVMLRSMSKAKYSAAPKPHFGLAIDLYCHFTSPIRRYPDLSVHRIVKKVLRGELDGSTLEHFEKFAEESAVKSSENELRALYAEREIDDLYKVVYMSDKDGEEYDGVVSSVTAFGIFVSLPNTVEGLVPLEALGGRFSFDEKSYTLTSGRRSYRLGQAVRVKIEASDIPTRRIEMSVVEGKANGRAAE